MLNRFLRKLKEKPADQKALERREQGFTLYMNGANNNSAKPTTSVKSKHVLLFLLIICLFINKYSLNYKLLK